MVYLPKHLFLQTLLNMRQWTPLNQLTYSGTKLWLVNLNYWHAQSSMKIKSNYFLFYKWANPGLFLFIFGLFKQTAILFLQQINVKNVISIPYTALGFEPMTSRIWVGSHNHKTRAPAISNYCLNLTQSQWHSSP